jgi:pilus assembly protein CpaE
LLAHSRFRRFGGTVQLSILLLASDRNAVTQLAQVLAAPGHGVTVVTSAADLLASAPRYSLVVIDDIPSGTSVAEVIAQLRADTSAPAVPVLAIARTADVEERIALLEANADDVLTRPFDAAEVAARVEALAMHAQRAAGRTGRSYGDSTGRRVIAVFSPKGGVGTTTLSTNLALIAAERHPNQTLIVDLDLSFGQVASHLNLTPKQTVLELTRDASALHDHELFRTYAIHHPGNLQVLAAPPGPGFTSLITAQHIEQILNVAGEAYEVVVVDAGTALDERAMTVFGRSDTTIIPVLPEIPALNSVHIMFDQLSDIGAMGGSILFVLNNAFARDLLKRSDIETALGAKIAAELPYDPLVYLKAVNEGVPVVRGSARSMPAERLRSLADIVLGPAPAAVPSSAPKERRGLFGRR